MHGVAHVVGQLHPRPSFMMIGMQARAHLCSMTNTCCPLPNKDLERRVPSLSPSPRSPRMTIIPAAVSVLLPLPSTLPRWRLLPRILPRLTWPSFSRICSREKSRASIRFWCIQCPSLPKSSHNLHFCPPSSLQALWKHSASSNCFHLNIPPTHYRVSTQACHHAQALRFPLLSVAVSCLTILCSDAFTALPIVLE